MDLVNLTAFAFCEEELPIPALLASEVALNLLLNADVSLHL